MTRWSKGGPVPAAHAFKGVWAVMLHTQFICGVEIQNW